MTATTVQRRAKEIRRREAAAKLAQSEAFESAQGAAYVRRAEQEIAAEDRAKRIARGREQDRTVRLALPFETVIEVGRLRVEFTMLEADATHRQMIGRAISETLGRLDLWREAIVGAARTKAMTGQSAGQAAPAERVGALVRDQLRHLIAKGFVRVLVEPA